MAEDVILEGRMAVNGALKGGFRRIHRILYSKPNPDRGIQRMLDRAKQRKIQTKRVEAEELEAQTEGKTHGGIIAVAGPRRMQSIDQILPREGAAFVAMLDGVEDPFSYAHALRSLYAAGVDGVVVRPRTWSGADASIAKASAGASERVRMAECESALAAAEALRAKGLAVACTTDKGARSLYEVDLKQPLFLLIGGERRGITRSFLDQADLKIQIPYGRSYAAALPTGSAAAVVAFEVLRARS